MDKFAQLVKRMRDAQKAYFKSRSTLNLEQSKSLERDVDKALTGINTEPTLFDEPQAEAGSTLWLTVVKTSVNDGEKQSHIGAYLGRNEGDARDAAIREAVEARGTAGVTGQLLGIERIADSLIRTAAAHLESSK